MCFKNKKKGIKSVKLDKHREQLNLEINKPSVNQLILEKKFVEKIFAMYKLNSAS